jgi:hypothetical protein
MSISSEKGIAGPLPAGKRRAWARLGAVVLVVLGLHAWHSCDAEALEPFSNIPAGGAGAVSLTSCGEGLEYGYIKCACCLARQAGCSPVLSVPKDYFNVSAGLAHVAFARSKAPKQPAKGSIMLNPGRRAPFVCYHRCSDACRWARGLRYRDGHGGGPEPAPPARRPVGPHRL